MHRNSAVLLITFNRPDNTRKVFEKIREVKVKKLYIANDAPRIGNIEDEKARIEIKKIIESVDWDCELHTNFQEKNLGCGWGPATAITWAFENEDKLIILEDDCVPALSFFDYCDHCLEKYEDDARIWVVSGRSDDTDQKYFKDTDYMFSHYGHSWGWATWKRCWQHFDMEMKAFPAFLEYGGATNVFFSKKEGKSYNKYYNKLYKNNNLWTHAWDFQFGFSIIKNGGLCIVPAKNLIKNIGLFGTHSSGYNKSCDLEAFEDYKITKEPKFILANRKFDRYHFEKKMKQAYKLKPLYKRIIHKILRIMGLKK